MNPVLQLTWMVGLSALVLFFSLYKFFVVLRGIKDELLRSRLLLERIYVAQFRDDIQRVLIEKRQSYKPYRGDA